MLHKAIDSLGDGALQHILKRGSVTGKLDPRVQLQQQTKRVSTTTTTVLPDTNNSKHLVYAVDEHCRRSGWILRLWRQLRWQVASQAL